MSITITENNASSKQFYANNPLSYPTCAPYTRLNATKAINGTSGTTFHDVFQLQAPAYRVRPIYGNGNNAGTYTVASFKACTTDSITNLNNAGTWATGALPSSGVVPASATTQRRGLLVGDWVNVVNVSDTKFVCIRSFIAAGAGNITVGTTENITNWATRTDGRARATYQQDVEGVTTLSNFTSTTAVSGSPCIGVQYQTISGVITVMKIGDSIDNGQGTYKGESYWDYAAYQLANSMNVNVEIANFAFASTDISNYPFHISDAAAAGIVPDVCCSPLCSPNGFSTTITTTTIDLFKRTFMITMQTLRQYGIRHVFRTWMPSNFSVKGYGNTDPVRVAFNNYMLSLQGVNVVDVCPTINGATRADGQIEMNPDYEDDGIHPNDAGNNALTSVVKPYLYKAIKDL